ncbi:hypothetical protein E2562_032456 [Oryza meyeriana var. granulata]|uniref:Uncharacterized protein n=1 Tax=Oryza meyeriana var. granulata TaxID=110450 RepID=A0A6G1FEL4_9ORYZ|nr:hypothetical protein E2562_032456 [Oryza meyeriana var. granulata]
MWLITMVCDDYEDENDPSDDLADAHAKFVDATWEKSVHFSDDVHHGAFPDRYPIFLYSASWTPDPTWLRF